MLFSCNWLWHLKLIPFIMHNRRIITLRMYSSFGKGNVSAELLAHSRAALYNLVYRSAILGSSSKRKRAYSNYMPHNSKNPFHTCKNYDIYHLYSKMHINSCHICFTSNTYLHTFALINNAFPEKLSLFPVFPDIIYRDVK